ncbi:T9SS type A sorting domain-containing protein [Flavobacterium sp.]|uniref:T9SS type A sorting domain-containing protein n=1 Tax=Flavobacterium sp. TaxID=239 RepID=UPI00260C5DAD|nr:T9SS type A sorting domain-containing protein [Flavobacterium sp.]
MKNFLLCFFISYCSYAQQHIDIHYSPSRSFINIVAGPIESGTTVTINYYDFPPQDSSWFWFVVLPYDKSNNYNPLAGHGRLDYSGYIYKNGSWSTTFNSEGEYVILIVKNSFNIELFAKITLAVTKKKLALADISEVKEAITIFPNPTDGVFKIEADVAITEIQIHDQLGRCVLKTASHSVDITAQPNGIYFATIQDSNGAVWKRKIIKK